MERYATEGISPTMFYGREMVARNAMQKKKSNSILSWLKEYRTMPLRILGPTRFWMEFDKQAEALAKAFERSDKFDTLCTFVYQGDNGYRKFVVAHPEMYWWHYEHRPPEKRCSYEIIPENSPCRLYLDLEYSIELNPESDGASMTNTIIRIFGAYLLEHWGLPCNARNVINLDSSTSEKFSRHIIFNIKDIAFKNNYHVGGLVKSIRNDILYYVSSKEKQHDILSCFDRAKLQELFVRTKKDRKLFIDSAVYTKNRHFRIYKSTKWGKQSNLTVSTDCKYIPSSSNKDKELSIFLDSLISYFINKDDLILLEWSEIDTVEVKRLEPEIRRYDRHERDECNSQYPILDKYIRDSIRPGKIRLCKFFSSTKVLVYETSGYRYSHSLNTLVRYISLNTINKMRRRETENDVWSLVCRYCENIGRCHKSNNVFWIVDFKNKTIYHKCHDEDCFGFKSKPKRLPEEVSFEIDEEGDTLLKCVTLTEDE